MKKVKIILILFVFLQMYNFSSENNIVFGSGDKVNIKKSEDTKSEVGIHFTEKEVKEIKETIVNDPSTKNDLKGGDHLFSKVENTSGKTNFPQTGEASMRFKKYVGLLCTGLSMSYFYQVKKKMERRKKNEENNCSRNTDSI